MASEISDKADNKSPLEYRGEAELSISGTFIPELSYKMSELAKKAGCKYGGRFKYRIIIEPIGSQIDDPN